VFRIYRMVRTGLLLTTAMFMAARAAGTPEAFELGPDRTAQLPGGKEADGIIGDFVMRNDLVELVISHNAPLRRANMSTFYGTNGVTPGCLFDLTLRGANNDQMVIFSPLGQQGPVSYVRVVSDGKNGTAIVETVITAAGNGGLAKRHAYHLTNGMQGVLIITTARNQSTQSRTNTLDDRWTRFASFGNADGIRWADSEDPADKAGYAYAWLPGQDRPKPGKEHILMPGQEHILMPGQELEVTRFLAVGQSPAEAAGVVANRLGPTGILRGSVLDRDGKPVPTAKILIPWGEGTVPAYPDAAGRYQISLPPGDYALEAADLGRDSIKTNLNVSAGATNEFDVVFDPAAAIAFDIRDTDGKSLPCKVQFIGLGETKSPNLGPPLRAHGCRDQYHSERGDFRVHVPPGRYRVVVTRGPEFSHLATELTVMRGEASRLEGRLRRLVDTAGWVSCDYHNHSTQSGDNTCGTADRLINLAAEHIEFAPATEHNRLFDWRPLIQRLGLAGELQSVGGLELTGAGQHMNSFPFEPVPFTQDNGAPVWSSDPRVTALTLQSWQGENPYRWIQFNHPDLAEDFFDRDGDGELDGGFVGLAGLADAIETQNFRGAEVLAQAPYRVVRGAGGKESVRQIREFIWLQMLNRGLRLWGTAVADAHSVHGNGVGGWRVYLPSSSDEPAKIDWQENVRNAKAGRGILTTGPFLQVVCEDGTIAGGATRLPREFNLKVRVQCTDWLDIDRVQVLVNGRQRPDLNFTRKSHPQFFADAVVKFDQTLRVKLSEDAHLIVIAVGEGFDLKTGFGTSDQSSLRPCAYNNPIFVDVDGNGFQPNGDTLGWPLPHGKLTAEDVKAALSRAGLDPLTALPKP
jgi:hypothetical protein